MPFPASGGFPNALACDPFLYYHSNLCFCHHFTFSSLTSDLSYIPVLRTTWIIQDTCPISGSLTCSHLPSPICQAIQPRTSPGADPAGFPCPLAVTCLSQEDLCPSWLTATDRAAFKSPRFLSSEDLEALPLRCLVYSQQHFINLPSVGRAGQKAAGKRGDCELRDRVRQGPYLLRTAVLHSTLACPGSFTETRSPPAQPTSSAALMVGPALAVKDVLGHSCVARGQNAALEAQNRAEGKHISVRNGM